MGIIVGPWGIIVPVHDGVDRLESLVAALDSCADLLPPSGELLFVDDRSADGSWEAIGRIARPASPGRPLIRGIRLDRNRGQQSALLAGLTALPNRTIITMDDDLSHHPESVPLLLDALHPQGSLRPDLAYAAPPRRPGKPLRRWASRLHQLHMALLTGTSVRVRVGSFRAFTPILSERILDAPAAFPYLSAQALGLRPRPSAAMVPVPAWPTGDSGRFSLGALMDLELGLALHHGFPARFMRNRRSNRTAGSVAAEWIAEEVGR